MTQSFPLSWPQGWVRTSSPSGSQFRTTLQGALTNVQDSLRRFAQDSGKKLEGVTISSNYSLTDQRPKDAGVAVYFTWDGLPTCIAVDRYSKIEENLQAIHHCIEAERTKLRHGGINLVRAAFRGYAALPPPGQKRAWQDVLGLASRPIITADDIETAYKAAAKKMHPDHGGSNEAMAALNAAKAEGLAVVNRGRAS